jgi:Spx/MgsR family transcriptional regulator
MLKIYGIPNCDQVKKSQKWLQNCGIEFEFHDFKKQGITKKQLTEWCKHVEWETLLNKRSRTWKELNANKKDQDGLSSITQSKAITLMQQNPTLIKRPVIQNGKALTVGFDEELFSQQYK